MKCPQIIKEAWITKQSDAMGRAVQKGILSISNAAKAAKKLKLKPRFLKRLGSGSEGIAKLMTHPIHGTAVNKIFNPQSPLFNKELIRDKVKILKKMKGQGYPLYYGKGPVDNSIIIEHLKGKVGDTHFFDRKRLLSGLKIKWNTFMRTGKLTSDYTLSPSNMIKMRDGTYKVVDFFPVTKNLKSLKDTKRILLAMSPIIAGSYIINRKKEKLRKLQTLGVK